MDCYLGAKVYDSLVSWCSGHLVNAQMTAQIMVVEQMSTTAVSDSRYWHVML